MTLLTPTINETECDSNFIKALQYVLIISRSDPEHFTETWPRIMRKVKVEECFRLSGASHAIQYFNSRR